MRIVVCLKQVADPSVILYDPVTGALRDVEYVANPLDLVALEEALRIADAAGAEVTTITVGPPRAEALLRQALQMGAHRAVRVWDEGLAEADAGVVARLLAAACARVGGELIIVGARSADQGDECVPAGIASHLGLPFISRVVKLTVTPATGTVRADRKVERGWRETYEAALPLVVSAEAGLNEPRYAAILSRSYRAGLIRPLVCWTPAELGLAPSALRPAVVAIRLSQPRPRTKTGMSVHGLTMADKLRVMRGEVGRRKAGVVEAPPAEAAKRIKEMIDEWLA